jgi:predicted SnoaL-like aldol condensation-catalyzing enzyme
MNTRDPKLTALLFNEQINNRDLQGLAGLMTENHTLIVRGGEMVKGREANTRCWNLFFDEFPRYRNTFERLESRDNLVIIVGHAYWSETQPYDPAIWTARIEDDRVAEWRISDDTPQNRKELGII